MSSLEELKQKRELLNKKAEAIFSNMDMIIEENYRVANIAHNASFILDDLDKEFEKKTSLKGFDISFLFFATALQCIRQYILSNEKFRFNKASDADKVIDKPLSKILNNSDIKRDYKDILLSGVPYDIIPTSNWGTGLNVQNHRELTLGHDPLFGWIFGTINIMTSSLTKKDLLLSSYIVKGNNIGSVTSFDSLLLESIDIFQEDYKILIAAVSKQAIHYASDVFTKKGLPLPILNNIAPDFNSKLIKNNIDVYGVLRGATVSTLINAIVATIHSLFYDDSKYSSREIYEVKTRKIISYSNAIASASNVIGVAIRTYLGDKSALKKLDIGGIMVTLYRLINDYNFIKKVKEEFVFGTFDKLIQGQEYEFNEV